MGSGGGSRRSVCTHISHPLGAQFQYYPGMRKEHKPSPTESPLLFEIDPQPIEETLTAPGGIPLAHSNALICKCSSITVDGR